MDGGTTLMNEDVADSGTTVMNEEVAYDDAIATTSRASSRNASSADLWK